MSEMMDLNHKFTVSSYNCKLFGDTKIPFIKTILQHTDFLLIQEHGLYKSNFDKLYLIDASINYHACSAMDENIPLAGRPHGGCGIIWKSN